MRSARVIWGLGLLCLAVAGCQNAVVEERDKLYEQNRQQQAEIDRLKQQKTVAPVSDDARVKALQDQIAAKDAEIARLQGAGTGTAGGGGPTDLGGVDATYDAKAGTLTVNIAGDVLFDSGKADLKASSLATLDKIADAIRKQYAGKAVRVEGHTDSDPIVKTKDTWLDNLDLSMERAGQVSRYLAKAGVDPKRITTSGYGQYRPKGNDKAANRRVEIVVVTR